MGSLFNRGTTLTKISANDCTFVSDVLLGRQFILFAVLFALNLTYVLDI